MSRSTGLGPSEETKANVTLQLCEENQQISTFPTHGVPDVDIALASPVVALREWLPIREHVAFLHIWALSKAIIIQPRSPVVHVARMKLPIGCSGRRREEDKQF